MFVHTYTAHTHRSKHIHPRVGSAICIYTTAIDTKCCVRMPRNMREKGKNKNKATERMCEKNTNETKKKKQIELIADGRTDGRDISGRGVWHIIALTASTTTMDSGRFYSRE